MNTFTFQGQEINVYASRSSSELKKVREILINDCGKAYPEYLDLCDKLRRYSVPVGIDHAWPIPLLDILASLQALQDDTSIISVKGIHQAVSLLREMEARKSQLYQDNKAAFLVLIALDSDIRCAEHNNGKVSASESLQRIRDACEAGVISEGSMNAIVNILK